MSIGGCVLAALTAAFSFALAALFQQRAARKESAELSLRPSLLISLVRRPLWLAGVLALVLGYGFQALALALGPVALVQPVITTELVFAVPVAGLLSTNRPGWREWSGVLLVTGGISLFLTVAQPAAGTSNAGIVLWFLVIGAAAAAVALALDIARGAGPRRRAMSLAAAAGVTFALLAVLTKTVTSLFEQGLGTMFTSWQTYGVIVVGILGLLFSQSAYQAGPLAFSMPVVAVVEPTVAVVIGSTILGEEVALSGAALALELLGAGIAASGVVLLATSPVVLELYGSRESRTDRKTPAKRKAPEKKTATRRRRGSAAA